MYDVQFISGLAAVHSATNQATVPPELDQLGSMTVSSHLDGCCHGVPCQLVILVDYIYLYLYIC